MVHRRGGQEHIVRAEAAEFGLAEKTHHHPRAVRQHHALGRAGGARGVGDGPAIPFLHHRPGLRRGGRREPCLVGLAQHDHAFDRRQRRALQQGGAGRVGKQQARLRVVQRRDHFGAGQLGVDGGHGQARFRHAADDFDVFHAVGGDDGGVGAGRQTERQGRVGRLVDAVHQRAVIAHPIAHAQGDAVGAAAGGGADGAGDGHRPERGRQGHAAILPKIRSAFSRIRRAWEAGRNPSAAISATARSGSITGQSVPNSTLWLP